MFSKYSRALLARQAIYAAVAAAIVTGFFSSVSQAQINWANPVTIAGDTDVLNVGSAAYAYDFTNNSATVNGVPFVGTSSTTALGTDVTMTGWDNNYSGYLFNQGPPATNLSSAYQNVVSGGDYTNGATSVTIDLNNLVTGHQYVAQVWVDDSRNLGQNRTETVNGGGNTVTLAYPANSQGALGQYTTGYFSASASSQPFTLLGNISTQLNAIQVRDVTGTWSGTTDGNWADTDATSSNFSGLSFTGVKSLVSSVYFGDRDAAGNPVSTSSVTVGAGGASIGSVYFQNNSVNYSINSAGGLGITGPTAVTMNGRGIVIFSATNTYTGGTTIASGALSIATTAALPGWNTSGSYTVAPGATLGVSNAISDANVAVMLATGNFQAGSAIGFDTSTGDRVATVGLGDSGNGALGVTKLGLHTLTTNFNNTYSGPTTVGGGTLQIGDGGSISNTSGVSIAGGATLAFSQTDSNTLTAPISGSGSLYKSGTGSLTLGGNSSYTGGTQINQGTISAKNGNALGWGNIYLASGGTLTDDTSGGSFSQHGTTITGTGTLNVTGGNTVTFGNAGVVNVNLSPGAQFNVQSGYLESSNSFGGVWYSNSASLDVAFGATFGLKERQVVVDALNGGGLISQDYPLIDGNSSSLVVGVANGSGTFSGTIQDNGGNLASLLKLGSGTETLSGVNTYTGGTIVNGGVLKIGPTGSINAASPVTVAIGGTLAVTASSNLPGNTVVVNPGGVLDTTGAGGAFSLGAGNLLAIGRPTLPATDILGNFTLGGGTLSVGGLASTVGTATLANDLTLGSGLVKFDLSSSVNGSNDLITVAGLNLSSMTTIDVNPYNGSLATGNYNLIDYSGSLAGGTSNLTLSLGGQNGAKTRQVISLVTTASSGGTLQLQITGSPANLVWTGSHSSSWDINTTQNWHNNGTNSADVFFNLDSVLFDDTAKTGQVTINAPVEPSSVQFNNAALTYTLSGSSGIEGSSTTLSKSGTGLVVLANANTYGAGTTVNGGTLQLGDGVSQNGSITGSVVVASGATFAFANPNSQIFGGAISGGGMVTKSSTGTLVFPSDNTYSTGTIINSGLVQIGSNHALGDPSTAVTVVNNGATLDITSRDLWDYTQAIVLSGTGVAPGIGALTKSATGSDGFEIRSITLAGDTSIGGVPGSRIDIGRGDWGGAYQTAPIHIDGQGHTLSVVGNVYLGILAGAQNLGGVVIGSGAAVAPHADNAFGGATVTINGGTLTPYGSHVFSDNLVVNSGYIDNQGFDDTYNGTVQVNGPLQINTIAGGNITFNGNISGSGNITKIGGYTLLLGGTSSGYTGTFTNNESNVFFTNENAGSALANWVLNGNSLANVAAGDQTIHLGSLAGTGGFVANNLGNPDTGQVTFVIGENNTDTTYSGSIVDTLYQAGTTAITKTGTGTLTLSGQNTYSGPTAVNAGRLVVVETPYATDSDYLVHVTNNMTIASGGTLGFNTSASAGGGTTFTDGNATISGSGTLVKSGSGDLGLGRYGTVTVALSPGALIDVQGGYLESSTYNGGVWYSNSASLNVALGATVALKENQVVVDALTGSGLLSQDYPLSDGNTSSLVVGVANGSGTFSGTIQDNGGNLASLLKLGTGTETLSGVNTYTGGTTVTEGTLVLASPTAIEDGTSLIVGADASTIFGAAAGGARVVSTAPAVTAVPEPGTLALLIAGLIVGCGVRRRRI